MPLHIRASRHLPTRHSIRRSRSAPSHTAPEDDTTDLASPVYIAYTGTSRISFGLRREKSTGGYRLRGAGCASAFTAVAVVRKLYMSLVRPSIRLSLRRLCWLFPVLGWIVASSLSVCEQMTFALYVSNTKSLEKKKQKSPSINAIRTESCSRVHAADQGPWQTSVTSPPVIFSYYI